MKHKRLLIGVSSLALAGAMVFAPLHSLAANATATINGTEVATPTEADSSFPSVDEDYIAAVHEALNSCREFRGNNALPLNDELNEMALAHAQDMAAQGRIYHSGYTRQVLFPLRESVMAGSVDAMHPKAVGGRSAAHAKDLQDSTTLTRFGIGAVESDGRIYVCVLGGGQPII